MSVSVTSALRVALVAGTGVTFNAPLVSLISTDDVYSPNDPSQTLTALLDALSSTTLLGSAIVDGTTVGDTAIFTAALGQNYIPTSILFALTAISGSGTGPSINVGFTGTAYSDYLNSTTASQYILSGGGFFAPGTGVSVGDVLIFSGGTVISSDHATITVNSTCLVSLNPNAAGTIYAPNDTITLAGGVAGTRGIVTVSTVKLVSATIHSGGGGTGYDGGSPATFNVTIAGGTHSTAATVNVTTNSSGVVSTINSVTLAGSYTVLPPLTSNAATGDDGTHHGTGLLLDLVFGVNTTTISNVGVYTTESTTFTQFATSGSGTGATFNTALYGALGYTISNNGEYSVVPANHITLTGGTGTGVNFDATWTDTAGLFANINEAGEIVQVTNFNGSVYMESGDELFVRVAFASTFTTYSLKVFVFGFAFT